MSTNHDIVHRVGGVSSQPGGIYTVVDCLQKNVSSSSLARETSEYFIWLNASSPFPQWVENALRMEYESNHLPLPVM